MFSIPLDLMYLLENRENVMIVREGIDGGEIAAKKDDSGHILMVNKQPHVYYYTLVYLGDCLFSGGSTRFDEDSALFRMYSAMRI